MNRKGIYSQKIGAHYLGDGKCEFILWAPRSKKVSLKLVHPYQHLIQMEKNVKGFWRLLINEA